MEAIVQRLVPMQDMFSEVAQFYELESRPWRDAGRFNEGEAFYQGPAGFSLLVGAGAVHFHHLCRFWQFTTLPSPRTLLRRFARQACEVLGGNRVIFAPDEGIGQEILDWVWDGWKLADVEAKLLQLSTPAATFEELGKRHQPPWTEPAYYIDQFHDMAR